MRRLYGVSTGGSHMFPDYYVWTDEPELLTTAAAYDCYKPSAWAYLDNELEIDSVAEHILSASLLEEPDFEGPTVTCPVCGGTGIDPDADDTAECDKCDGKGVVADEDYEPGPCAFILDVFPVDEDKTRGRPVYDSIEDALSDDAIARAKTRI